MKYKGNLIVVKDCNKALAFYRDVMGFELIQDNDGNMELSGGLYLQESKYWEKFTEKTVISKNNCSELYFEEEEKLIIVTIFKIIIKTVNKII